MVSDEQTNNTPETAVFNLNIEIPFMQVTSKDGSNVCCTINIPVAVHTNRNYVGNNYDENYARCHDLFVMMFKAKLILVCSLLSEKTISTTFNEIYRVVAVDVAEGLGIRF